LIDLAGEKNRLQYAFQASVDNRRTLSVTQVA